MDYESEEQLTEEIQRAIRESKTLIQEAQDSIREMKNFGKVETADRAPEKEILEGIQEEPRVKEPWIVDDSYCWYSETQKPDPEPEEDNIRIWVPLDLNRAAILRRLRFFLDRYGDITWRNESAVSDDVYRLTYQIEKYDQINLERHPEEAADGRKHSKAGLNLVKEFIGILEEVDTCCDFPYDVIERLKTEYDLPK